MFYLILIGIIVYLSYKEYKFSKNVAALTHMYLHFLQISYVRDKKQTTKNLYIYDEFIANQLVFDEYDLIYKTLSESWKIPYYKDSVGPFADGKKILPELIRKLEYTTTDSTYQDAVMTAEMKMNSSTDN